MLSVDEHLARLLSGLRVLPAELTAISEGEGRGLAENVVARLAVPPFDNSAMDGFAVRAADVYPGAVLRVVGDIPAGAGTVPEVGPGQAARIMTGAPLPPGADAVLPVELTDQPPGEAPLPETVTATESVATGRHIRRCGENVAPGDLVLARGTTWGPAAASSAASVGYAAVPLVRRPRVAVISTGSELVSPGKPLGFGQIPDSNSLLLAGLVRRFAGEVMVTCQASDERSSFATALEQAAGADLIVTTGGVSVGAFEVVRQATTGQVAFEKVAMQPGKPQAFGTVRVAGRDVALLGLPGNPVSVFVSAWVFLRPMLAKLGGRNTSWPVVPTITEAGWVSPPGRRQYVPVRLTWGDDGVRSMPVHRLGAQSHLVASLQLADALAVVAEDTTEVSSGNQLSAYLVR